MKRFLDHSVSAPLTGSIISSNPNIFKDSCCNHAITLKILPQGSVSSMGIFHQLAANHNRMVSNRVMRKAFLVMAGVLLAACLGAAIGAVYILHQNSQAVTRARLLASDLQKLAVGTSDYKAAQVIASKYGTVPYRNDWGTMDCADGYFERCAYMIPLHNRGVYRLTSKYPLLNQLLHSEWGGTATIAIAKGTVAEYSFWITYRASNGQLRGFGAVGGSSLPSDRAVQAKISDTYSVERNDIRNGDAPRDLGFELEASLTPAASATERRRAWNLNFACLTRGCGEICEVMPDAWRDFYLARGHFDVDKFGAAYMFCRRPPDISE